MYVIKRTTVYLPDELEHQLEVAARASGLSKAELIRRGVRDVVASVGPRPRIPLFTSARGNVAEHVDALLEGFGER